MSSYHGEDMMGVAPRRRLMSKLCTAIRNHLKAKGIPIKHVVLVGTGISGVSMAATLSHILRCRWGFVRKPTDTMHHGGTWYEPCSDKYIIGVDDFISSGDTIRYICKHIMLNAVAVDCTAHVLREAWLRITDPAVDLITPAGEWNRRAEEARTLLT